jgi:c-di-GMP-binding flagellar brake protein YcgR
MRIQLRFNQPVSIQLPGGNGDWHSSVVLNHIEDTELVIAMPASLEGEEPPAATSELAVEIALPDGLRRFSVRVLRVIDAPPSLALSWPEEGERIQRREAVRVPIELPAEVRPVLRGGAFGDPVKGKTSDISAGGMRLNLPQLLEADSLVRVTVQAPDIGKLECTARVLRGGELKEALPPNLYWVAIIFANLPGDVLRDINRLVVDVQRSLMRRNVL